ncbi:MAG: hypothetical protein WCT77_02995 [Bacteroidota bacterium]|jgi:hypothetical protein
MKTITEEEALKDNILKLAKEHKDKCHTNGCGISLYLVRKLAEKAGITFTDEEKRIFM